MKLRIERINLHMRGVSPETARQAANALGPEIASTLAHRRLTAAGGRAVDAGRVTTEAAPESRTVAARIAQRIARAITSGE